MRIRPHEKRLFAWCLRVWAAVWIVMVAALIAKADTAQQAATVLRQYCYSCHGVEHNGDDPRYDVTNFEYLRQAGYASPGNPDASKIIKRIANGSMPPEGNPAPNAGELQILRQWIAEGAKDPAAPVNSPSWDAYVLSEIIRDSRANVQGEVRNFRYFSLANVPAKALPQYHAALSKAVNSLTLRANITLPVQVDEAGYVLRIDQRDYGWNGAQWQRVLNAYPYYEAPAYVRADWFIANALKPPIYYDLLGLPNNERALETLLGINTDNNIRGARSDRAGVLNSGVAFHNRVLERHQTRFGAYWKSYDFADSDGRQNILRFPLGPRGTRNDGFAFEEAGTEIIFDLPNGLHGYYVANANGGRLNAAPPNIVADRNKVSGTLDVVPGISCIACHSQGIQDKFTDIVRLGSRLNNRAAQNRVLSLYADPTIMRAHTAYDKKRYLAAVEAATGSKVDPVGGVALVYQEPLDIAKAVAEVGARSADQIDTAVRVDRELSALIRPLLNGGTIQRAAWESKELGQSPAERLADLLRN